MFDILLIAWLGKPLWMWLAFFSLVGSLLVFDLGVLNRKDHAIEIRESLYMSAFYIALGLLFGLWVWWYLGPEPGINYVTGFALEKALAMDNVFIIALVFRYFAVPRLYQHRVLFWGIVGVIVLRALMIGFGIAAISHFSWVLYIFGLFLIATGLKTLFFAEQVNDIARNPVLHLMRRRFNVTDQHYGRHFFVKLPHPKTGQPTWFMTPMFLALALIEGADILFAVDSVPAIFAITTDPFIVYTSNIFAILGLRALYFTLAAMIHRFHYLKYALALVLIFIGAKIFVAEALDIGKIPPAISLGVTLTILTAGVLWSLWKTGKGGTQGDELSV
ncbi:membrane protein [Microvirga vignae]|uniref:Membrane protein n=1 Tax=Microvirga vignae TaxID=1225564 RepID=A0A0H1RHD3_9HYPH|nr:TerC family protein [Microvirga vignae]KLK92007.1 membrane protein [Microvirga vignae]